MVVETLGKLWSKLGIKKGDTLLVHSNISSLLRYFLRQNYGCTPENVFDSLMSKIGPDGTVLLPTFNFEFCEGVEFNIYKTTSQMGILSEYDRSKTIKAPEHGRTPIEAMMPNVDLKFRGFCKSLF